MIGPGWLPRYRPRGLVPLSKRIAGYTRTRRRAKPPRTGFDRRESNPYVSLQLELAGSEFPVATVRPREARGQIIALVASLQRWLVARWQWLRPRSVPCAVACLGMIAVLAAADYLAHHHGGEAQAAPASVRIELAPR